LARGTVEDEVGGQEDQPRGVGFAPMGDGAGGVEVDGDGFVAGAFAGRGVAHRAGVDDDGGTRGVERSGDGASIAKVREQRGDAWDFSACHRGNLAIRWLRWPAPPGREGRQMREHAGADEARCAGDEDHGQS
jgi:hypothetical protein